MCEPAYQGRNLLQAARGSGQHIKGLKAAQSEENVNDLVMRRTGRKDLLLDQPLCDNVYSLPSPFVSCPYHLLKIWVEGSQRPQPACDEPIRVPEAAKDQQVLVQHVERLRLAKGGREVFHPTTGRQGIAQGFEQPALRAKLMINSHASHVCLTSNLINRKRRETIPRHQQFAGGANDARSGLFGS